MGLLQYLKTAFRKPEARRSGSSVALPHVPLPENAAALAEWVVGETEAVEGLRLDYSVESIREVDRIILELQTEPDQGAEVRGLVLGFGCYVGEVWIANHGGTWVMPAHTRLPEPLRSQRVMLVSSPPNLLNPIGKAFKRFELGELESLETLYLGVTAQRASLRAS